MSSDDSSTPFDLPSLEKIFLMAFGKNDSSQFQQFNAQLSYVLSSLEKASSLGNPISHEASKLVPFLHNVYITSSTAHQAQLDMDEICNKFSQQLQLLPKTTPSMTPSLPSSRSQDLQTLDGASSSDSTLTLKNWSLLHMSYLFPTKEQLDELASQTSMTKNQITLWFRNARTRSGWSKLHVHPSVNKNQSRIEDFLKEYNSIERHGSSEAFTSFLARNELLQLLDKVLGWFAPTKPVKPPKSDSINPRVMEVLSNALGALKNKTAGAMETSRQILPALSSRKRARTKRSTPSPSPLSQSASPIAGPSSAPRFISESPASSLPGDSTTGWSLSQSASPIAGPSSAPRFISESPASLLQPSTTGSFPNAGPHLWPDFPQYLGALTNDSSSSSGYSSGYGTPSSDLLDPSPSTFSLAKNFTPASSYPSLTSVAETPELPLAPHPVLLPPFNSEASGCLFDFSFNEVSRGLTSTLSFKQTTQATDNPSNLLPQYQSAHLPTIVPTIPGSDQSAPPDQFDDAEE